MVFESVVAYFLDKYLSSYIENFDSSKLKIGIWSGKRRHHHHHHYHYQHDILFPMT